MTKQEILTKAIQKAIDNGWNPLDNITNQQHVIPEYILDWYEETPESIIYNHDFAKALWGQAPYYRFDGDTLDTPTQWQVHLQQMVISEDPIKYLGEHLN